LPIVLIAALAILLGVFTGYILVLRPQMSTDSNSKVAEVSKTKEVKENQEIEKQDSYTGKLRRGGINGQGSHYIVMEDDKKIFLVAQKNASDDEPKADEIHSVGTIATILRLLKLPDGTVKVLVEGDERAQVQHVEQIDNYFSAEVKTFTTELKRMTKTRLGFDATTELANLHIVNVGDAKRLPANVGKLISDEQDSTALISQDRELVNRWWGAKNLAKMRGKSGKTSAAHSKMPMNR